MDNDPLELPFLCSGLHQQYGSAADLPFPELSVTRFVFGFHLRKVSIQDLVAEFGLTFEIKELIDFTEDAMVLPDG